MRVQDVAISPVESDGTLVGREHCACSFCGKGETLTQVSREMCEKLSKPGEFYCRFCLRNNLYARNNRHTLIMTFRSVFAYYYLAGYKPKKKLIYLSEINDYVRAHEKVGLENPSFRYDPESFLWFVDFEKIGTNKRQLPLEETYKTVVSILTCFNFYNHIPTLRTSKFYEKYREAIETFYKQRSRPEGKKILCPTFAACGLIENKEIPFDRTRDFSPKDLV